MIPARKERNVVVLLDASASVWYNQFDNGLHVCEVLATKVEQYVKDTDDIKIIAWNSSNYNDGLFQEGVYVNPTPVPRAQVKQHCIMMCTNLGRTACTSTWLGFRAIPREWLELNQQTVVMLATDGAMGWGGIDPFSLSTERENLAKYVLQLPDHVGIDILCVEPESRDFSEAEQLTTAAGIDVYAALCDKKADGRVTSLVSHGPGCPPEGFVHIRRSIAPPGYVAFRGQLFSKARAFEMRNTVIWPAVDNATTPEEIMRVTQEVMQVLRDLGPSKVLVDLLAILFKDKTEYPFIKQLLGGTLASSAVPLIANIKSSLYKQATETLKDSVRSALGVSTHAVSFLHDNVVWVGNGHQMTEVFAGCKEAASMGIPLFDCRSDMSSAEEQCLRQWTRSCLASIHHIPVRSNAMMFQVMEDAALVPEEVAPMYRLLAKVMLSKAHGKTTVLRALCEDGLDPASLSEWQRSMNTIAKRYSFPSGTSAHHVWWWLLAQLQDPELMAAQKLHCLPLLATAVPSQLPSVTVKELPVTYDYTCPITLDDTSQTGGFCLTKHGGCCTTYVFKEAFPDLRACPFCHSEEVSWGKVPPLHSSSSSCVSAVPASGGPEYVIFLEGAVGSGKTTLANALLALHTPSFRASMDECSMKGMSRAQASSVIQAAVAGCTGGLVVVDTCRAGDRKNVFGYMLKPTVKTLTITPNYNPQKWREYLMWSTRNVLLRTGKGSADTFMLCPEASSIKVCLTVAQNKSCHIVGKKKCRDFFKKLNEAPDTMRFLSTDWTPPISPENLARKTLNKLLSEAK